MPEKLLLHKVFCRVQLDSPSSTPRMLGGEQVVGIQPFSEAPAREYGYEYSGTEHTEELAFSSQSLSRILEFYRQTRAQENPRVFYNCHVFAGYVAGQIVELPTRPVWKSQWQERAARPDHLEAGEVYTIKDSRGIPVHSLLGMHEPDMSLSVVGDRQGLVVCEASGLMEFYGGTDIVHKTPL